MSGCKETSLSTPKGDVADPTVTLEVTILSVIAKDVCPVDPEDPCPLEKNPLDWGEIRIDKVIEYHGDWWDYPKSREYKPLVEGENRNVRFAYSTRPTKVRCVELETDNIDAQPSKTKEPSVVPIEEPLEEPPKEPPSSIPRENGFFIFTYYTGKCPLEKVLPGLKEGDRIRFTSTYSANQLIVGEYEIIP